LGATNWVPDRDQIVRRVNLIFRIGDTLVPSFAAETLRVALGAGTIVLKSSNASGQSGFGSATGLNHIRIGDYEIPTDAQGAVTLRFRHSNRGAFIPAWKVLSDAVSPAEVGGRIVLVGTSVPGLVDLRPTPLDATVPGVEIHGQAIENVLAGSALVRPDYALAVEEAIVLAAGLFLTALMPRISAQWLFTFAALAAAALLAGGWAAYYYGRLLLDPLYPVVALFAFVTAVTFYIYRYSERQRSRIKDVFITDESVASSNETSTSA
jgi:adenylate cyclase